MKTCDRCDVIKDKLDTLAQASWLVFGVVVVGATMYGMYGMGRNDGLVDGCIKGRAMYRYNIKDVMSRDIVSLFGNDFVSGLQTALISYPSCDIENITK